MRRKISNTYDDKLDRPDWKRGKIDKRFGKRRKLPKLSDSDFNQESNRQKEKDVSNRLV